MRIPLVLGQAKGEELHRNGCERNPVMTPMDLQDRAQYLSLALFAQQMISALMEYADEGKSQRLNTSLRQALNSLLLAKDPSPSASRKVIAFSSYEQIRTLEEVWSNKDRVNAIRMMRAILRAPNSPKSKEVANDLISMFSGLQNQALWNFEQPKPVSPRVMQRLCQLA